MPEQMTIRERVEWLAVDERRKLEIGGCFFRVSAITRVAEQWNERPADWFVCDYTAPLFDEGYSVTKVAPEPTELEKAEAELEEALGPLEEFWPSSAGTIKRYIEARFKVERLRAEVRNGI